MWAITSYYNPVGYKRRLSNYRIFRANLGVPLVTVELSFDGRFELNNNDADILIQIHGGAVLWQKERLLNIAIRSLPRDVGTVAWIDCDVIFDRSDWVDNTEAQLREMNIVQLFSDLVDLGPEGYQPNVKCLDPRPTGHGIVSAINSGAIARLDDTMDTWQAIRAFSTGIAWAARMIILEEHGFYDAMIAGGGDRAMLHAMYGQFELEAQLHHLNSARRDHYLKWARPFNKAVAGKITNIPGKIYHLWHGNFMTRRNRERHRMLAAFNFDPNIDLTIGSNGAWHWAKPRPDLEDFMRKYFLSRNEDE
jgi:hypothetical protein